MLETLSQGGVPAPEVGFELCGEDGVVLAEAELAWPERQIAVLWPDEPEPAEFFARAGWRTLSGDVETLTAAVAKALGGEDR